MLGILDVLLGGALLILGRRLFWLFVSAIGFIVGVEISVRLFHGNELLSLLAGLGLGLIFALLAIFVETLAIGLSGFFGGGYVGLSIVGLLSLRSNAASAIAFIVGGALGVVLIMALFQWALITISSLAGSAMVVSGLHLPGGTAGPAFLVLLLAGVIIQGLAFRRGSAAPSRAAS